MKGIRGSVTDFTGVATGYTFDGLDRLTTATTPDGVTHSRYFADGLLKAVDMPTGVQERRCYDAAGQLVGQVTAKTSLPDACPLATAAPANAISRFGYGFDGNGNRVSMVEERTSVGGITLGAAEVTTSGYDSEDRLVGVAYADGTTALYQLDAVGNRIGERKAPSSLVPALTVAAFLAVSPSALANDVTGVFSRADWLTSLSDAQQPARNAVLAYDADGNMVSKTTAANVRTFAWDSRGTLTQVADNGLVVGQYDYAADGLRQRRDTGIESVEYVLDDAQVLVEADGRQSSHPAKRRYHYGASPLAVSDISTSGTTTSWFGVDALGSVATQTSSAGAVTAQRQYDAYGQYRNGTAPTAGEAKLGFTGHQYDVESGLVYARARYYDPELGRFISRDSYGGTESDVPSLHRFAYARGNPLRFTDPDGRCTVGLFTDPAACLAEDARGIVTGAVGLWNSVFPDASGPLGAQADVPMSRVAAPAPAAKPELPEFSQAKADKAQFHRQYLEYLNAEAPMSGDAYDIYQWQQQQANARSAEVAMQTTDYLAHAYLEHVAVPYLVGEATLGAGRFGGSALLRGAATEMSGAAASGTAVERTLTLETKLVPETVGVTPEGVEASSSYSSSGARVHGENKWGTKTSDLYPDKNALPNTMQMAGKGSGGGRGFASGKAPHEAQVKVVREGEVVSEETLLSGNMTEEEAALGFPQSSLATHTEARAVRSTPLKAGDKMTIKGKYQPCPSCKGKMNQAAEESGATIEYQWGKKKWTAEGGNNGGSGEEP